MGGNPAAWASASAFDSRWAPENFEVSADDAVTQQNYMFFADTQVDGLHRIGWVATASGATVAPQAWTVYSSDVLNLGGAAVSF